jgi:hypothetical protein
VLVYKERASGQRTILLGRSIAQVDPLRSRVHQRVEYMPVGLCSVAHRLKGHARPYQSLNIALLKHPRPAPAPRQHLLTQT